jgi:hypothetical protein
LNLSDVADIGSLVNGVAVLASLVYLSVRHAQRVQQAAMHRTAPRSWRGPQAGLDDAFWQADAGFLDESSLQTTMLTMKRTMANPVLRTAESVRATRGLGRRVAGSVQQGRRFVKHAGALVALAICSACGASSAVAPSTGALNVVAARPSVKAEKFEYVMYSSATGIFDYPKSDQQVGTIKTAGGQACTNGLYGYGKATFWIVVSYSQITEYEVRKKPIKTLSYPAGEPSSCAMDLTGDLAVGSLSNGDLVIFKDATGSGTVMTTPLAEEYFDGYDPNGNLFLDGFNGTSGFELVELPKGSRKFEIIATSNTVKFPGSVQWDGTYLTVTDQEAGAIYRYTVSGTTATLQGSVSLSGASDCAQTWIATGVVYCADAGNDDVEVFKYPAGGAPIAVLKGKSSLPLGVVAAQK